MASYYFINYRRPKRRFFWWHWAISSVGGTNQQVLEIEKGENVDSVATNLKKAGLVRSPFAFKLYILINQFSQKIQAGNFQLTSSMSLPEITNQLTHGRLDIWITFLEGWRNEQMAAELIKEGFPIDQEDWEKEVSQLHLEGYLFPDTYLFPKNASLEVIISTLKNNFDQKVDSQLREEIARKKLTLDQVVTLASIVEREVKSYQDRSIVAGILIKRRQSDWPLQADATVQYTLANLRCRQSNWDCDWWPKNLTIKDLEIDSPYNTYRYPGLPPEPICNPSLSSVKAVINWQETPYWFYLSDGEGKIHYSRNLQEHNANIAKYLEK